MESNGTMHNPIQPLYKDGHNTVRFKANAIVRCLLDHGSLTLNDLAILPFNQDDQEQFAQLIGYSHSGFGELSYASDEVYDTALLQFQVGRSESEARAEVLRDHLQDIKEKIHDFVESVGELDENL